MSELTSTLKVVVDGSGAKSGADEVKRAVGGMKDSINRDLDSSSQRLKDFGSYLQRIQKSSVGFFKSVLNSAAIVGFTHSLIKANKAYAAFMAISKVNTGSLEGAKKSFDDLASLSNRLGTSLEANMKSFGKFQAALRPIDEAGTLTKHLFEGMSIAATGLHLNSLQLELSFKALEQAASKGRPTLEEFQRQLAEHIPGAMAYLAEGVGLKMSEIHDAISNKTIGIQDLLVGFANVLKKRFGDAAEYASKQLPASIERLKNAYFQFLVSVSTSGGAEGIMNVTKAIENFIRTSSFAPAIGKLINELSGSIVRFIESIDSSDIDTFVTALKSLGRAVGWVIENFKTLALVFIGSKVLMAFVQFGAALKTIAPALFTAAKGTKILTTAFVALRTALRGPLGILALLGSLVYLLTQIGDKSKIDVSVNKPKWLESQELAKSTTSGNNFVNDKMQMISSGVKFKSSTIESLSAKEIGDIVTPGGLGDLLGAQALPKDNPEDSDKSKKDPLEKYISNSPITRLKEYYDLLGKVQVRFKGVKSSQDIMLKDQVLKELKSDYFTDILGDGNLFTVDKTTADALKDQNEAIREMSIEMSKAQVEALAFVNAQNDLSYSLKNTANGDFYANAMRDITTETAKAVEELFKFKGILSSDEFDSQLGIISSVDKLKRELAAVEAFSTSMSNSQALISSAEQSMQSQVITGLISETGARMKLRGVIGEQGRALQSNLLPQIRELMATISDPTRLAQMQAIVDKINEMVAIGQQHGAFEGFKAGLREYRDEAIDMFTEVKEATKNAFQSMEDALVNFVKTGKLDFRSLAESIISDIIRIQVRSMMSGLFKSFDIGSLFTSFFANGGVMTEFGSVPLRKYASGGIAHTPQLAMYGEGSMPEAFVPLPDGRSIPVTIDGASGGDVNTNIVINIASDGSTSVSRDNASQLSKQIESAVTGILIREKRAGGLLAGAA